MSARSPRRPRRLTAVALTAVLALSAVGTAALTAPGTPSLAVFDRGPTALEIEKELALRAEGYMGVSSSRRAARESPEPDRDTGQRVWAVELTGSEANYFGTGDLICLLVESTPGTTGALQSCMEPSDVARRGFVPLDAPAPYLFVDGEQFVIEWGPTGEARLIERPALRTR